MMKAVEVCMAELPGGCCLGPKGHTGRHSKSTRYWKKSVPWSKAGLNKLASEIRAINVVNGWGIGPRREFGTYIALMHSELSEALEAYRNRQDDHIPEELADCLIRILDFCALSSIDIERAVRDKMEINKTRGFRHGNKRL